MRCDSVLSRLRRSVVSKPGERAPPRDTGDARPGGLEKDRGDDDAEKCICGGILSRRCCCRSRGGGQPRAAVGQARVLLRSRETANRTSSPANLCASESVRRSRVRYARSGACMAQKQTTHQSLHEPGDTWTSCRACRTSRREAIPGTVEQILPSTVWLNFFKP